MEEKHFAKFVRAGQVIDMTFAVATARDPAAYLKRRLLGKMTCRRAAPKG